MSNNYNMKRRKSVSISEEVYNRISENGKFGESMTDVLERILDQAEAYRKKLK